MRTFIEKSAWSYGEKEVTERGGSKSFTLTQPHDIFREDYYHVRRCVAVENVPADVVPENDFFVYEICYMCGVSLCVEHVAEDAALELISENLSAFLQGGAEQCIRDYFYRMHLAGM